MPDFGETIGSAFIAIQPETSAFSGLLTKQLLGPLEKAGSDAGGIFGKAFKLGIAGVAALGGAAVAAGGAAVDLAANYDSALSMIAAKAGISKSAADDMGKAFLSTAGSTTFSATAIAQAFGPVSGQLEQLTHGALTSQGALTFMKAAMDGAEATSGDLNDTTAALARTLLAFGDGPQAAAGDMDILTNAANMTNQAIPEVSNALDKLKGKLGEAAPSLADSAALIVDLNNAGLTGGRAIIGMTSAFEKLLDPGKAAAKVLSDLKVHVYDNNKQFVGMSSIIDQLKPKLDGMTEQQRIQTLTTIFGAQQAQAMNAIISDGSAAFDKQSAAIAKQNSAQIAAQKATDNFKDKLKTAESAIKDAGIAIGTVLLPYVTKAADWLGKHLPEAINTLHGWIESHKQDIQHWAGVIKDVLVGAWNLLSSTVMGVWSRVLGPFINWLGENQGVALAFGAAIAGIFAVNKIHTWLTTATSAIQTVLKLAGVASVVGGKGGGGLLGSLIPVAGGAAAAEGGGAVAATPLALLSTVFAGASAASVAAILGAVLIPAAGMAALAWWGTNQAANNQLARQVLQGVDVGGSVISGSLDVGSFAGMSGNAIKEIQKKLDDAGMASGDIDNELTTLAGVAATTGPLTAVQLEVFQSQWEQGNHGAGDILDAIKTNGPAIQRGVDQTASVWGGGPSSISGHASATNALSNAAKGHFGDLNNTFGITVPQINTALGLTSQQTGGTAGSARTTHSWWDGWNKMLGTEGNTVLDDINKIIDAFSKPPEPVDPSVMNQIADALKSPGIQNALNNINAIAQDYGNLNIPKPSGPPIGVGGAGPNSEFGPAPGSGQHGALVNAPMSGEPWILHGQEAVIPKDRAPSWLWQANVDLLQGRAPVRRLSSVPSTSTGAAAAGVSVVQHFHINGGDPREVQSIIHREFNELQLALRTR